MTTDKLFTSLGEKWERIGYSARSRYCRIIDETANYRGWDATYEEYQRALLVGEYLFNIEAKFIELGHGPNKPYFSGGITCSNFKDIVNNATALYKTEVGEPNPFLATLLKPSRLRKCIKCYKHYDLLEGICYGHCFNNVVEPSHLKGKVDSYWLNSCRYPVYRVDGTIKVIAWANKLLATGVALENIHYCQYHGDSYCGEYIFKERNLIPTEPVSAVSHVQSLSSIDEHDVAFYREEMIRARTLSA